jgi:hypothetical protein
MGLVRTAQGHMLTASCYDYLLSMPMGSLTAERVGALEQEVAALEAEFRLLEASSAEQLWERELVELRSYLTDTMRIPPNHNTAEARAKREAEAPAPAPDSMSGSGGPASLQELRRVVKASAEKVIKVKAAAKTAATAKAATAKAAKAAKASTATAKTAAKTAAKKPAATRKKATA